MVWNVEGKVGVITGASCALGREITQRLAAQHRMKIACVSRKTWTTPLPTGCTAFQADISHSDDCDALLRRVKAELGPVSLLINCAGVTLSRMHMRCTDADYDAVMNTNLRGALQVTRAALRHGGLLQTQDGSVLHIGSVAGVGMATSLSEAQQQRWREACPLKRLATVTEVADIAVAVALCPYVNGQTIAVDGGLS